jgi:FtsZ-binding cell division protein ZapB
MISLEQVKLLETKVAKAIDYVEKVTAERDALQEKVAAYQKRIDELEVLAIRFKEDQSRIEDGILSALDRLNQFEEVIEKSLVSKPAGRGAKPESSHKRQSDNAGAENAKSSSGLAQAAAARPPKSAAPAAESVEESPAILAEGIFFEIPEEGVTENAGEDSPPDAESRDRGEAPPDNRELDIF